MEGHRLADGGHQLDAVGGLELVDVDDPEVLHHAQVHGLAERVAQGGQVRPGDAPKIEPGIRRMGERQDPSGQPVATGGRVLGHVAGIDERPEQADDRGFVEADAPADRRRPEGRFGRPGQSLEHEEPTAEGSSRGWFV